MKPIPEYFCGYCAKPFEPPVGKFNDPDDPLSHFGWELVFCSRDCALLAQPEVMLMNGW